MLKRPSLTRSFFKTSIEQSPCIRVLVFIYQQNMRQHVFLSHPVVILFRWLPSILVFFIGASRIGVLFFMHLSLQAFTRNNCDRKESDGPLDRFLQGAYGPPVQAKGARGNDAKESGSGSDVDRRANAAKALSTFSGAAFAVDGIGREVAGLFTSTSDGIFF